MGEPKLCPIFTLATRINFQADVGIAACLQDKCAMWRTTETIVQEQHMMVNRQVTPEIIRTDHFCGLAGKP